jgi:hypothetical protein
LNAKASVVERNANIGSVKANFFIFYNSWLLRFVEYYNYMNSENNNSISKKPSLALVALKKHRKIKLLFIDRHRQSAMDAK